MDRSDVSFTFLDRIREIEENIEDGRFQSALALAVTLESVMLPADLVGWLDGYLRRDRVSGAGKARPGREDPAGQIRGAQPGYRAAVFPVGGYIRGPVFKKGPG